MIEYIPSIGDKVFIYSCSLDEIIEGVIEGYADEYRRRYKVLQKLQGENAEFLRHIVSESFIFSSAEEAHALLMRDAFSEIFDQKPSLTAGNIVYLLDSHRKPIKGDNDVDPYHYQVVSVYAEKKKVGLVTSYGEYIGTYPLADVIYVGKGPMFIKEDYELTTTVVWADGEDVYEGVILDLGDSTAKIGQIKKLMPVDYFVRVPYWKIPEGRKSMRNNYAVNIPTVIGDDLD